MGSISLGVFVPQEHLRARCFEEELEAVQYMSQRVLNLRGLVTNAQAFYQAWIETHPSDQGLALFTGADQFYSLMREMVLRSQVYFNYWRDSYLWKVETFLRPHNAASNPVDPLQLLALVRDGVGKVGTLVHQQVRWESTRILATAFGFAAMEIAHPEHWIADEVTRVDALSRERFYAPRDLVSVHVAYGIDRDNGGRVLGTPIASLSRTVAARARATDANLPRCRNFKHHFKCRTVIGEDGTVWLMENGDRRKDYIARLLKRHDGKEVGDSCGTSCVLVAMQSPAGELRLATREDVSIVRQLAEERLWSADQLRLTEPRQNSTRHRNGDYWDLKLRGQLEVNRDGQVVKAEVEQIFTSLIDYLNQIRATDGLNHRIRRGYQLACVRPDQPDAIPPAWQYWPEQIYGLDWSAAKTQQTLKQAWAKRFADRAKRH